MKICIMYFIYKYLEKKMIINLLYCSYVCRAPLIEREKKEAGVRTRRQSINARQKKNKKERK
jgi:hypothetical protein